ncbi:MAG TPA: hypothetical protein VM432_06785 [Bdellovibrionales bacterium]|nr:hypothetical protein [Bdellovibrionales bacterium]
MKSLFLAFGLLFSAHAFAFPQQATLNGQIVFGQKGTKEVTVELKLDKLKTDKAKYKGDVYYMAGGKQMKRSLSLEVDLKDGETSGKTSGFRYYRFSGPAISLESGSLVELEVLEYELGDYICTGSPRERCRRRPDHVVDQAVLTAIVE